MVPKSINFDLKYYSDADFGRCWTYRKSSTGACHFLSPCLVSRLSKKQLSVALSGRSWIHYQLMFFYTNLIDETNLRRLWTPSKKDSCVLQRAISLSKNLIQHSRAKHIEVRHHFIRDKIQKGIFQLTSLAQMINLLIFLQNPLVRIDLLN